MSTVSHAESSVHPSPAVLPNARGAIYADEAGIDVDVNAGLGLFDVPYHHECADDSDYDYDYEPTEEDWAAVRACDPLLGGPCVDLAEFLDAQAASLQSLSTSSGAWLAAELAELASQARSLSATTAEVFCERRAADSVPADVRTYPPVADTLHTLKADAERLARAHGGPVSAWLAGVWERAYTDLHASYLRVARDLKATRRALDQCEADGRDNPTW